MITIKLTLHQQDQQEMHQDGYATLDTAHLKFTEARRECGWQCCTTWLLPASGCWGVC